MPVDSERIIDKSLPPGPLEETAWRSLLLRVCESPQFRKASRMRELLTYLTERSVENSHREITEYEIADKVFGRGTTFDPAESNVVRVGVRQLRLKLKEYFDEDGKSEPSVIEMPRGGYRVAFVQRLASEPVPAPELPVRRQFRPWLVAALAAGLALAVAAVALLAIENRALRAQASHPYEQSFLSALTSAMPGPIQIVGADPGYGLIKAFGFRPDSIEDYETGGYIRDARPDEAKAQQAWRALLSRQMMNVADVNILYRLAAQMRGPVPHVRMARQMKTRDFRSGNFLILGTQVSNPWHLLFAERLNFRFESDLHDHGPLRNMAPRPGEPERFNVSGQRDDSFALVALTPNLTGTGKVLLIAGFSMAATEAAGDFLLNPAQRGPLLRAIGAPSEGEISGFELVLRTRTVSGTAKSAEIAAVR